MPQECDEQLAPLLPSEDTIHTFRGCAGTDCSEDMDPADINTGVTPGGTPYTRIIEPEEGEEVDATNEAWMWLRCTRTVDNPGMAYGVAGSLSSELSHPAVGMIGVICGPYANVEWSMNWDFLNGEFRLGPDELVSDLRTSKFMQFRWLNDVLTKWFVSPSSEHDYLAATPLHMCPPNYVMRGVEVAEVVTESRVDIRGITAVYCTGADRSDDEIECESNFDDYPCKIHTHVEGKFGDSERSISQRIGDPELSSQAVRLWCEDGEYVSGLAVSPDEDTVTHRLSLSCAQFQ